jgi:hypothetical protein
MPDVAKVDRIDLPTIWMRHVSADHKIKEITCAPTHEDTTLFAGDVFMTLQPLTPPYSVLFKGGWLINKIHCNMGIVRLYPGSMAQVVYFKEVKYPELEYLTSHFKQTRFRFLMHHSRFLTQDDIQETVEAMKRRRFT